MRVEANSLDSARVTTPSTQSAVDGSSPLVQSSTGPTLRDLNEIADYLHSGYRFDQGNPRVSWPEATPLTYSVVNLSAEYEELADMAFLSWTATTGIEFVEVAESSAADIIVTQDQPGAWAEFSWINRSSIEGDLTFVQINVEEDWVSGDISNGTRFDTYTYQTFIHEIGHALGLGHPGPYDASDPSSIAPIFEFDSWQASVMSYFSQDEAEAVRGEYAFNLTPMPADLIAIAELYGFEPDLNTQDNTYFHGGQSGYHEHMTSLWSRGEFTDAVTLTLVDDGGHDVLDFRQDDAGLDVDLTPGSINDVFGTEGTFLIERETWIEELHGGQGDDVLSGNDLDNILSGGGGEDTLYGGDGTDTVLFNTDFDDADILVVENGFQISHDESVDTVIGFERFAFRDQTLSSSELGRAIDAFDFRMNEDSSTFLSVPDLLILNATSEFGTVDSFGFDWRFTPAPDFNGLAEINYSGLARGGLTSQSGVRRVLVDPVNDAPDAEDDHGFTFLEGETIVLSGLLDNDTDVEGDTLTIISARGSRGDISVVDNEITAEIDEDFFGELSFQYFVSDGQGGVSNAQAFVTVEGTPDAPIARDDFLTVTEGEAGLVDVLRNDRDPDRDELTLVSAESDFGLVEIVDNELQYVSSELGRHEITYTIADSSGETSVGVVNVTVQSDEEAAEASRSAEEDDVGDDGGAGLGAGLALLGTLGVAFALYAAL